MFFFKCILSLRFQAGEPSCFHPPCRVHSPFFTLGHQQRTMYIPFFFSLCLSPARFYSSLLQCHANERTANKFPVYFFESIHNVPVVAIFAPSSISSSPCGPRQTNLRRVESYWRHCGLNKIRAWTDSVLRVDLICPTRPNIASSLKTQVFLIRVEENR